MPAGQGARSRPWRCKPLFKSFSRDISMRKGRNFATKSCCVHEKGEEMLCSSWLSDIFLSDGDTDWWNRTVQPDRHQCQEPSSSGPPPFHSYNPHTSSFLPSHQKKSDNF